MPFRARRRPARRPRRRLLRRPKRAAHRRRPGMIRSITSPHQFRVIVASKDFGASCVTNGPLGSLSFNNVGMTTITTTAVQTTFYYGFSMFFTLDTIPTFASYVSAYDRFNIQKVVVKIYPVCTSSTGQDIVNPSNSQCNGFLHWVIDSEDANLPSASDLGVDTLRRRPSYRMVNLARSRPMTRTVMPRIALGAYSGAFTSYANRKPGWIDTASPSVQHYGLKGVFEVVNPSAVVHYINFKVEATYYFRLKDPL